MVEKIAAWVPVSVELLIDTGHWDDLSADQQATYLEQQAAIAAYRRSWRYRRDTLRAWVTHVRRAVGYRIAGYGPYDERDV